jgi:hypothetical protein
VDYLLGNLYLKGSIPKCIQKRGIESQQPRTPFPEFIQKPPNRTVSEGLLEQDHQAKRHKVLICDIQQESLKETPPKRPHGNSEKRLRKSPKRKNRRNIIKP